MNMSFARFSRCTSTVRKYQRSVATSNRCPARRFSVFLPQIRCKRALDRASAETWTTKKQIFSTIERCIARFCVPKKRNKNNECAFSRCRKKPNPISHTAMRKECGQRCGPLHWLRRKRQKRFKDAEVRILSSEHASGFAPLDVPVFGSLLRCLQCGNARKHQKCANVSFFLTVIARPFLTSVSVADSPTFPTSWPTVCCAAMHSTMFARLILKV